jgi:hypothetical protein
LGELLLSEVKEIKLLDDNAEVIVASEEKSEAVLSNPTVVEV